MVVCIVIFFLLHLAFLLGAFLPAMVLPVSWIWFPTWSSLSQSDLPNWAAAGWEVRLCQCLSLLHIRGAISLSRRYPQHNTRTRPNQLNGIFMKTLGFQTNDNFTKPLLPGMASDAAEDWGTCCVSLPKSLQCQDNSEVQLILPPKDSIQCGCCRNPFTTSHLRLVTFRLLDVLGLELNKLLSPSEVTICLTFVTGDLALYPEARPWQSTKPVRSQFETRTVQLELWLAGSKFDNKRKSNSWLFYPVLFSSSSICVFGTFFLGLILTTNVGLEDIGRKQGHQPLPAE